MTTVERALELMGGAQVIGLGTGRAATAFVQALGERVRQGQRIRAVPTSLVTTELARSLAIPLTTLRDVAEIDFTVDGADEVSPSLDLIKGYGGALLREKIVATISRQVVILVGPEKLVKVLGARGRLPIEVVPFALFPCQHALEQIGLPSEPRRQGAALYITDNRNYILDAEVGEIPDAAETDRRIREIPGVIATGLFPGMADTVLVQDGDEIREQNRPCSR